MLSKSPKILKIFLVRIKFWLYQVTVPLRSQRGRGQGVLDDSLLLPTEALDDRNQTNMLQVVDTKGRGLPPLLHFCTLGMW